jgi:hypothetical protein
VFGIFAPEARDNCVEVLANSVLLAANFALFSRANLLKQNY